MCSGIGTGKKRNGQTARVSARRRFSILPTFVRSFVRSWLDTIPAHARTQQPTDRPTDLDDGCIVSRLHPPSSGKHSLSSSSSSSFYYYCIHLSRFIIYIFILTEREREGETDRRDEYAHRQVKPPIAPSSSSSSCIFLSFFLFIRQQNRTKQRLWIVAQTNRIRIPFQFSSTFFSSLLFSSSFLLDLFIYFAYRRRVVVPLSSRFCYWSNLQFDRRGLFERWFLRYAKSFRGTTKTMRQSTLAKVLNRVSIPEQWQWLWLAAVVFVRYFDYMHSLQFDPILFSSFSSSSLSLLLFLVSPFRPSDRPFAVF